MLKNKHIAILGGGPSGLFMYKRLVEAGEPDLEISIFERKKQIGAGMPYSTEGANVEHITNVSDNEIPKIVTSIEDWVKVAPQAILDQFQISPANFNEYKVLPRLFFGAYLGAQFEMLIDQAKSAGITTHIYMSSIVKDIIDEPAIQKVKVRTEDGETFRFDSVIVCTGHNWPNKYEGKVLGYFDSPYPPGKLAQKLNHPVAIKGSSLTAIDAIRTLARHNGCFTEDKGQFNYKLTKGSEDFRIIIHSRNGLLPAVRFHLEDSHLHNDSLLTKEELSTYREQNEGFLSLDYLFDKDFKALFSDKDPELYQRIKDMKIEEFVSLVMEKRIKKDPFQLLKEEYAEAEKSIELKESIYWKEMLAILSFAMNYPAKYLSAEDMLRLQKVLMPLISIVIAFVPQSSCRELIALHQAGTIDIIAVGDDSRVEPGKDGGAIYHYKNEKEESKHVHFKTFVDCVGQPHLSFEEFPFKGLTNQKVISRAKLKFKSKENGQIQLNEGNAAVEKDENDNFYLKVQGIAINDNFQVVDDFGAYNERIYMMAVPYIGGFNPDYSGLDFCEEASGRIVKSLGG
jgi:hypothetical protein